MTKLWHTEYDSPEDALRQSLQKLQMSYVDLYLIHWPNNGQVENKVPMHILWRQMEVLVDKGLAKKIGLSNFNMQLISDMLTYARIRPFCNQMQIYPECAQEEMVNWLNSQKIEPIAYSPTGRVGQASFAETEESSKHPYILGLAAKYDKTPI